VIEAMKMANSIKAQRDCTIVDVLVSEVATVHFVTPLFKIA
jgi:biotin carboxyl carrier protein